MRRVLLWVAAAVAIVYGAIAIAALLLRWRITSVGDETTDEFALAAVSRGVELRSRAEALRGGSARALMGGLQLDLREATLDPAGARLELAAVLGGIELIVPPDWNVEVVRSRATLGVVAQPPSADTGLGTGPLLELHCLAVLGGIDVAVRPAGTEAETAPVALV